MWNFYVKKMLDFYGQSGDLMNSPFAFPRMPPRANPPLGISSAGRIKDSIVNDANAMMERLYENHIMFQRFAAGLFNLAPDRFVPGHPMHSSMHTCDTLEKNEQLTKENTIMKSSLNKVKK
jgi:hypothetical protein